MFVRVESRKSRVESQTVAEDQGRSAPSFVIRHSSFVNPPSPQPPAPSPQPPRSAITLTEVLISLGILTIGLLGVAALFPVGSYYMQKGEIADRGSAIAQAAFNEAITRGMLDPANWLMMREMSGQVAPYDQSFTQQLITTLNSSLAQPSLPRQLNARVGYAYVIDPFGVNGSPLNPTLPTDLRRHKFAQQFPFAAQSSSYTSSSSLPSWAPWQWSGLSPATVTTDPRWPLVRISLPQAMTNSATTPMTDIVTEKLFRTDDDLALDVPSQSNKPSIQRWEGVDTDGDGKPDAPLARQSRGDYSWIITVVPPSSDARNALATDPTAYEYEVSVAVFYKRTIDNMRDYNTTGSPVPAERLVNAQVVSTGLNGGQLLLSQITGSNGDIDPASGGPAADPFGALKSGNWVVVCGPHPASTDNLNRFVVRWYRVLSIEGKDSALDNYGKPGATDGVPRRLVSLRGPQWPWQPATDLSSYSDLSNYICVAIVPSVVAVHSKSIRLEGKSAWSIQ